jgi:heterodisulfide reductase subunit A
VHLVEKDGQLGGYVRNLNDLWMKSGDPMTSIDPVINQVLKHPRITTYLGSKVISVDGHIGDFQVAIRKGDDTKTVRAGVIIVAIGAREYIPEGMYGYDQYDNVVTLAEMEILARKDAIPHVRDIAFIQCVGARGQLFSYCSRICCNVSLKNAIGCIMKIREALAAQKGKEGDGPDGDLEAIQPSVKIEATKQDVAEEIIDRRRRRRMRERETTGPPAATSPEKVNITIFNRTINAYGVYHELYYAKAREQKVKFILYDLDHLPQVTLENGKLGIKYYQHSIGDWRVLKVDMVVLATPLVPTEDAEEISKLLKVPRGQDGFFLEAHTKLRPVDFATEGIFLAGTCRAPADITESVLQANAAASRASIPLTKGYVQAEAVTSQVIREKCSGCGTCQAVCPYGAIEVKKGEFGYKAQVNVAACKGCGCCAASCPEKAIKMNHYTDVQLLFEAMNALKEESI